MAFRKTTLWCLFFLLVLVAVAAGAGWWLFESKDRLLREKIEATLAEKFPGWEIELGDVDFDFRERLTLTNVRLSVPGQSEPLVDVGELIVGIDRDLFSRTQQIDVRSLTIRDPVLHVSRTGTGLWNFQKLPPLPASEAAGPRWDVRDATVHLDYQHAPGTEPVALTVRVPKFCMIPSGHRRYDTLGTVLVDEAGLLEVTGEYDLDRKSWTVEGTLGEVVATDALVDLASNASPGMKERVAGLKHLRDSTGPPTDPTRFAELPPDPFPPRTIDRGENPSRLGSNPENGPIREIGRTVENPRETALRTSGEPVGTLGVAGSVGVRFRMSKWSPGVPMEYKFLIDLTDGQIDNPLLPFPLRDIEGQVYIDNRQVIFHRVTAANGITRLSLDGRWNRDGTVEPGVLTVSLQNLRLDERCRQRLPADAVKLFDMLRPSGRVNAAGEVVFDETGGWTTRGLSVSLDDCTMMPTFFPYPVHEINGTVEQTDERVNLRLTGSADGQPVAVDGWVNRPGPDAECYFEIATRDLSLDERVLAAIPPAAQAGLRQLRLTGFASGTLKVYRPGFRAAEDPGFDVSQAHHWHQTLAVAVRDGSLNYTHFPWRIDHLSGRIDWASETGRWVFSDLSGVHAGAPVTGSGAFTVGRGTPNGLSLALDVQNAALDQSLYDAVPQTVKTIWNDLSPTGMLDLRAEINWVEGQEVAVSLSKFSLREGTLLIRQFPWPLTGVTVRGRYEPDLVTVTELKGNHGDTRVEAAGSYHLEDASDTLPETWRLRLDRFAVDDLVVDRVLQRAIPEGLREMLIGLNLRGKPASLSGRLELRGALDGSASVTSAWEIEAILAGASLSLGLDLKGVFGSVTSRGTYDGENLRSDGRIDLDSVFVMDYQFTEAKGPYRIVNQQVTVGSPKILANGANGAGFVPLEDRLSAQAIGGTVTMDAFAVLGDSPAYRVKAALNGGRLEQYAMRYAPGMRDLSGVLNGWIDLSGRGSDLASLTGRGQLQVSPATIYELPVVFQMLTQFPGVPADKTAFRYAFVDFNIAREQFQFNVIDLVGQALSLRGQGWCRFDKQVALDFYSMMGRNQVPIPLIGPLVNELSKGWVGVRVRGKIDNPLVEIRAIPELDDALRGFLGPFNPANAMPRLNGG